tara:strand:- start:1223 stop:1633 length:411 start_codon:yes stop_codon:yes gene_type:complete
MNAFEKKFMLMLEQDVELPAPPSDIESEIPGESPDFEGTVDAVDDVADNPGVSWRKDQNNNQRATIQAWIGKVSEFTEFLNGTEGESVQKQLADADCDTLFNEVSRSETKKITRIAQDLSALQESLKGYLISSDDE